MADELCRHLLHYHQDDEGFLRVAEQCLLPALGAGGSALAIVTPERAALIQRWARHQPFDPGAIRYMDSILLQHVLMPGAEVDKTTVKTSLERLVRGARRGRTLTIIADMVSVLWRAQQPQSAVDLEEVWVDVLANHNVPLLCIYDPDTAKSSHPARLRISELHDGTVPSNAENDPFL